METEENASQPEGFPKGTFIFLFLVSAVMLLLGLWLIKTCVPVIFDATPPPNPVKMWGGIILSILGVLSGLGTVGFGAYKMMRRRQGGR